MKIISLLSRFLSNFLGSSNSQQFIATHFDLHVTSPTDYTTYLKPALKRKPWSHYHSIKTVGKIPLHEITNLKLPHVFAVDLESRLLRLVYIPLFNANNGPHWSPILNCQTITRLAIQLLGFTFPEDIPLIADVVPTMFDFYLNATLTTAQMHQHTNELSC